MNGGEEVEVLHGLPTFQNWALSQGGAYFATWRWKLQLRKIEYQIRYLDFASGQVTDLFTKEGPSLPAFLTVSPDERWVLYVESRTLQSELKLVENFY